MADEKDDDQALYALFDDFVQALVATFRDLHIEDIFAIQVACLRIRCGGKDKAPPLYLKAPDGTETELEISDKVDAAVEALKGQPNVIVTMHGRASAIALMEKGVHTLLVGKLTLGDREKVH